MTRRTTRTGMGRRGRKVSAGASISMRSATVSARRSGVMPAGSLIGSGPVHSAGSQQGGRREWPRGFARLADKRAVEALQDGAPKTGYLRPGDAVRIEAKGKDGESLFGAIEQELRVFGAAPAPDFRR